VIAKLFAGSAIAQKSVNYSGSGRGERTSELPEELSSLTGIVI